MKKWITEKLKAASAYVKSKIMPKIDKASPVVKVILLALLFVAALAGVAALFVAVFFFVIMLPGMIIGAVLWFGWTHMGFGATYFPGLEPAWHALSYWNFVFMSSVLIFFLKILRKEQKAQSVTNNTYTK